jgi:hypothetical protein
MRTQLQHENRNGRNNWETNVDVRLFSEALSTVKLCSVEWNERNAVYFKSARY